MLAPFVSLPSFLSLMGVAERKADGSAVRREGKEECGDCSSADIY